MVPTAKSERKMVAMKIPLKDISKVDNEGSIPMLVDFIVRSLINTTCSCIAAVVKMIDTPLY